jgi:hypothetical protein
MASLPRYSTAPLLPLLLLFALAYVCDPDSNRPFLFLLASLKESSKQLSDWLVKGSAGLAITTKLTTYTKIHTPFG